MSKSSKTVSEVQPLTAAFTVIASSFSEVGVRTDRETGEVTQVNSMAFVQKRILNGICYSLEATLSGSQEQLEKAGKRLNQIVRTYAGGEIDKKNLESAQSWVERLQEQVETVFNAYVQAKAVYEATTAEKYLTATERKKLAMQELKTKATNPELAEAMRMLETLKALHPSAEG